MKSPEFVVRIRMPWWFKAYTNTLIFLCVVFGTEPNWEKYQAFVRRHIKAEMKVK